MNKYANLDARLTLVALFEREMPLLLSEFMKAAGCEIPLEYEGKEGIQPLLPDLWSLSESATLECLQATGLDKSLWGKCANALVTVLNIRMRPLIAEELGKDQELLSRCNCLLDSELAQAVERIVRAVGVEYSKELRQNNDELQSSIEEIRAMNEELQTSQEEIQTSLEEVDGLKTRLEVIMQYASDAVFVVDSSSYQIKKANIRASALVGYPVDKIKGNNIVRFLPAPLLPGLMERFEKLRGGQHLVFDDMPMINHKLEEVPVEISAVQIKVSLDTFFYFSIRDITERKKAEEELSNQRRLLQTILDNIPDLIVLKDQNSVYQAVNPAFCNFVGRSAEEIIGRTDYDLFPRNEAEAYRDDDARIMSNDERYLGEEHVGTDGNRWLHVAKTPVKDASDHVVGILCSVRDITKLKDSEEAFGRAQAELDQIFQTAADGMRVIDQDFNIIRVNDTFAEMTGLDREEIHGKKCYEVFSGKRCHTSNCPLKRILKGEEKVEHECKKRRPDGTDLSCIVVAKPFKGPDGGFIGIIEDFRDITERQKLESQIRHAQKMESIGTLAGGIAHDFNNLLGGMLGYTSIIKMNLDPLDRNYKYIELIEKAGERAAELTNQLLAFSRKAKYQTKPVDLNNRVHDVVNLLERTINKNISLRCAFCESLPMVEGDPGQIEQIIMNLCVNAVDAMPGGGSLDLKTSVRTVDEEFCANRPGMRPGEHILLEIKDTGIGMDKETTSKIFEPFFTTKEVGKGTGLGMSMVYGTVNNHQGYIDVESALGKGTAFKIYLPAATNEELETMEKEDREEFIAKGNETILVVDDEEIIRTMLKDMLESLGYTVIAAAGGREAIDLYRKQGDIIDLVIVDMLMPDLNGEETYLQLKELCPEIKVILASGYFHDGMAKDILKEGISDFVHKPFTVAELSGKIRYVLIK
jgi:two-component system cell cycle sensor histidine kinase/response regulator CckA